ncbi:hypothetical protein SD364_02505 [Bacteroides fragilis]
MPQRSWQRSQYFRSWSMVVSALHTTTLSRSGELPLTTFVLPVFLLVTVRSLVCIARPVFSFTIRAISL